jgi:hypothetical protein
MGELVTGFLSVGASHCERRLQSAQITVSAGFSQGTPTRSGVRLTPVFR